MYNGRSSSIRAVQLQGGVDVQDVARWCDADVGVLVLAMLSYWTMAVDAAQAAAQRAEEEEDDAKADAERNKFPCYEALEAAPVQHPDGQRTRVLGVVKEKCGDPERKEKEAGRCSNKVR